MDLSQFLLALRARRKAFVIAFAVTVLTAIAVALILPKKYVATATLLVDTRDEQTMSPVRMTARERAGYLQTQVDLLKSNRVATQVARDLKLAQKPGVREAWEKDTGGAIKWKLIAGGQIADAKATFTAVKDGLMQGGLGIVTYVPNAIPSVYAIYSTNIFGESDPVAASGAALETMYLHCPSCLEELRKQNSVNLAGWTTSAYMLTCREPLRTMADLKGKRVRATGGNADMLKIAGMVPVGATLVEAVGLLQRGGLDCQHGIIDWVRTFGYGDVAKYIMDYPLGLSGPALGILMNRDTWKSFTPEQKKVHLKYGAWLSAKMAIGNFIISNEEALNTVMRDKGVQLIKVGNEFAAIPDEPNSTQVTYYLSVDLVVPLPGFVKRRAEARIMHTALDELKTAVEARAGV